jgi:hypothetical protein
MPTADGKPIFEDLVALLQTKPSPLVLSTNLDTITGAFVDLVNRVRNLEHASLVNADAARVATDATVEQEKRIAALETDRTDAKKRLDAVEKTPVDVTAKLDAMDKRIRTVEGAVGSTNFAAAKAAPETPALFKGPDPTAPIANP